MRTTVFAALLIALAQVTYAELYSFSAITSNDMNGLAPVTGESQLYMDVSVLATGEASLLFTNTGPARCFISSIHFDTLPESEISLLGLNEGEGVSFLANTTKPKNLPAGNTLDPKFLSDLTLSARNPAPKNGINPNESLEILLTFNDAYDLITALETQEFRVGLHVQGFAGGYSESFINGTSPTDPIPEPGTLSLLAIAGLALRRVRFWFMCGA